MVLWQVILWAVLTVALIIVEINTIQMVAVWFAAGGLVAFIASLCGASLPVQLALFVAASVVLLAATRPIVRKVMNGRRVATNADGLIGRECVVKEEINNLSANGRVFVEGLSWSARNAVGDFLVPAGTRCVVREIQGVKLMVEPLVTAAPQK